MIIPSGYDAATADLARFLNFVTSRHRDAEWVAAGRTWRRQPDGSWIARSSNPVIHDMAAADRAAEYGAMEMHARGQMYGWDDLKNDPVLGRKVEIVDREDGTREANLTNLTADERKRLIEMESGHVSAQLEIAERRSSETSFVTLVSDDGRSRQVPEQHEEKVARRDGMRRRRNVKPVS